MATAAKSRTFRMFPPTAHATFTMQRGATIDATANSYVDVVAHDAEALFHAGWTRVIEIGTTANRPLPGPASDIPGLTVNVAAGYPYYDTTLGVVVFYSTAKKAYVDFTHTAV